jgi:hypothetical protein
MIANYKGLTYSGGFFGWWVSLNLQSFEPAICTALNTEGVGEFEPWVTPGERDPVAFANAESVRQFKALSAWNHDGSMANPFRVSIPLARLTQGVTLGLNSPTPSVFGAPNFIAQLPLKNSN